MGVATFRGLHNEVKAKAFLFLASNPTLMFSCREIAEETGLSCRSLRTLLPKWVKWRYLLFKIVNGIHYYQLGIKAQHWLARWQGIMPGYRYIAEVRINQAMKQATQVLR
jgi:hypothetical protein